MGLDLISFFSFFGGGERDRSGRRSLAGCERSCIGLDRSFIWILRSAGPLGIGLSSRRSLNLFLGCCGGRLSGLERAFGLVRKVCT